MLNGKKAKRKSSPLNIGLDRDLNPGPLAPKARIIRLDHRAALTIAVTLIQYGGEKQFEVTYEN